MLMSKSPSKFLILHNHLDVECGKPFMPSDLEKNQSVRYDVSTQISIGPQSKKIRLKEVGNDPYVKQAPKIPSYLRTLTQAQQDALSRRCSIFDVQEKVKVRMDDKKLAVGLRSRLLTWIEDGAPGNAETYRLKRKRRREEAARLSTIDGESLSPSLSPELESISDHAGNDEMGNNVTLEQLQNNIPLCFKIMADASLASAYHHQGGRLDESAIKNPVPSRILKASQIITGKQGQPERENDQIYFILSVSIYARPPRGMWVKERFDRIVRSATESQSNQVDKGDMEGIEWENGERFEIPEKSKPGPKPMLGRTGPYEALQLAQQIEIRSDCTLKDLREGFVCRMDDLPEAVDQEKDFQSWSKLVSEGDLSSTTPQMHQFTGRKRETDSCFLIEDILYGQRQDDQGYERLLSSQFSKTNEERVPNQVKASTKTMDDVRLDSIDLHTGKLYWFLHQGSCEHVWAITSIRQARLSEQKASAEAITHYLKYNFLVRPLVRWARPTKRVESYSLDLCNLCEERQAVMIVIAGERFRPINKEVQLEGLKEENVSVCETCWYALNGQRAPSLNEFVQRAGSKIISDKSISHFANAGNQEWTVIPLLE